MPFVIDGYNLLHAIGLPPGSAGPHQLAKARAALIGSIGPAHAAESAIVVFDARRAPPDASLGEVHGQVTVEYVTSEEADDRIEWLIAHDPAPKKLIVVSDDQRIQRAARRRGCPAWKCGDYLDWLEKERGKPRRPAPGEKPAGSPDADRWLAAFGELDRDPAWDELFGPFEEGMEK
jgi:predicted RNA-binding protein with PIN domain